MTGDEWTKMDEKPSIPSGHKLDSMFCVQDEHGVFPEIPTIKVGFEIFLRNEPLECLSSQNMFYLRVQTSAPRPPIQHGRTTCSLTHTHTHTR